VCIELGGKQVIDGIHSKFNINFNFASILNLA